MKNNYFISALSNYINALPYKKDAFYMDSDYVNYYTLINFLFTDSIMCNNILNVNENYLNCQLECGNDENIDFFQYYIVNIDPWRFDQYVEYCKQLNIEPLTIYYLENLDIHLLAVDHFGTSWDYVPTNIKIEKKEG